ncbi:MAG: hypothetical protein ACYCVD_18915 [Desulfitobacteriaceae bacterium]
MVSRLYPFEWYANKSRYDNGSLYDKRVFENRSDRNCDLQKGACLNIYWYDTNKNPVGTTILFNVLNSNWQRYVATLQPPQSGGAAWAKVMAITYGPYDGYFNNIQFERSSMARGYNYLEDSSFELQ